MYAKIYIYILKEEETEDDPVTLLLGAIVEAHSTIWYSGAALVPPTNLAVKRPHFNRQLMKAYIVKSTIRTEIPNDLKLRSNTGVMLI